MNVMKTGYPTISIASGIPQLSIPPIMHTNSPVMAYMSVPRQSYNISPTTPHPSPIQVSSPFPCIECSTGSNFFDSQFIHNYSTVSFPSRSTSNQSQHATGIGTDSTPIDVNSNIEGIPFWTWFYSSKLSPKQQHHHLHQTSQSVHIAEYSKPGSGIVSKSSDICNTNSAASTCQSPCESLGLVMSPPVIPLYCDSTSQTDRTSLECYFTHQQTSPLSVEEFITDTVDRATDTEELQQFFHISTSHCSTQTESCSLEISSDERPVAERLNEVNSMEQDNVMLSCGGISGLYLAARLHSIESRLQELNLEMDQIAYEQGVKHEWLLPQQAIQSFLEPSVILRTSLESQSTTATCSPVSLPSPSSLSCGQEIIDEIMAVSEHERRLLALMTGVQQHYHALRNKLRRCKRGEWLKESAEHYADLIACRQQADQLLETFSNPTVNALSFLSVVATEVDEGRILSLQQDNAENNSTSTVTHSSNTREMWRGEHNLARRKIKRRPVKLHSTMKKHEITVGSVEGPTPCKQAKVSLCLSTQRQHQQQHSVTKTTIPIISSGDEDRGSPRPPTPDLRRCDLDLMDLSSGIPILLIEGSYLKPGVILNPAPNDQVDLKCSIFKGIGDLSDETGRDSSFNSTRQQQMWNQQKWLVQLESDRKPLRCLPAYELLSQAVLEVRPSSIRHLPPGTRVCAHWSKQMADKLYPGTVVEDNSLEHHHDQVAIAFDDSDFRHVPLHQVRMLPEKFDQLPVPIDSSEVFLPVSSPNLSIPQVTEPMEERTYLQEGLSDRSESIRSLKRETKAIRSELKRSISAPLKGNPSKMKSKRKTSSQSKSKVNRLSSTSNVSEHLQQSTTNMTDSLEVTKDQRESQGTYNVLWTPIGEITKSSKWGTYYRSAKRLVDSHTIRIGDAVQMIGGEDSEKQPSNESGIVNTEERTPQASIPIYIGRILEIFQDKTVDPSSVDAVKVNVQWYYTPEEALGCCPQEELLHRLPEGALLQSDHPDVNEARTIIRRVRIAPQYSKLKTTLSNDSDSSSLDSDSSDSLEDEAKTITTDETTIPQEGHKTEARKASHKKVLQGRYFLAGRIRVFPEKNKQAVISWNREMLELGRHQP